MKVNTMNAVDRFQHALADHLTGKPTVAVSVCSAHPDVLSALFRSALEHGTLALIETTPSQVNLSSGYTGLSPERLVSRVMEIATAEGFAEDRILLGADHLGPAQWRHMRADDAMSAAERLAVAYVRAGYRKIHLDASRPCADDPIHLPLEVTAHRCAHLAAACEEAGPAASLIYVVGSDVPTPGGDTDTHQSHVTRPEDLERTLSVFSDVFAARGLGEAWRRVVGVVVAAGVTFGEDFIVDYAPLPELARAIACHAGLVFEAHSTDYQRPEDLKRMVENHFFILKVGPWLTYTLREALFLLELMEREMAPSHASRFRKTLISAMMKNPVHWQGYYGESGQAISLGLSYGYSDRCRYYLSDPAVVEARERLLKNLGPQIPESLISQYMPMQYPKVRAGRLAPHPRELMIDRIRDVLGHYMAAGVRLSPKPAGSTLDAN